MATQTPTELQLFHQFVGQRLAEGQTDASVDATLEEFRQLADLREKIDAAIQSSERGESGPFDIEETIRAVRERLADHGIHESS